MIYSDYIFLTKKRLTEWGRWCYQIVTMGLNYSNSSLMTRVDARDGLIRNGNVCSLAPSNESAEEVNELIEKLASTTPNGIGKPVWANVVRIHYTMRGKSNKEKIKKSGLDENTYYRYLRNAEDWLSNHLTFYS